MSQSTLTQTQDDHTIADETLMLAYAQGDASAFEQLYQRHKQMVYRYFMQQCASIAIAEELCHDTWLKLINARLCYVKTAKFRTYLFTIARNTLIDHSQKKSTKFEQSTDELEHHTMSKDRTATVENHQLANDLRKHINALPPKQRDVFILKQQSGFSIEQIATITKQQKEQVKSSWRYALQRLRQGLNHYAK
jgi:RNA polymerase sigma-70 factor (ECF subfamily)